MSYALRGVDISIFYLCGVCYDLAALCMAASSRVSKRWRSCCYLGKAALEQKVRSRKPQYLRGTDETAFLVLLS
jgi:hypothetical protein